MNLLCFVFFFRGGSGHFISDSESEDHEFVSRFEHFLKTGSQYFSMILKLYSQGNIPFLLGEPMLQSV